MRRYSGTVLVTLAVTVAACTNVTPTTSAQSSATTVEVPDTLDLPTATALCEETGRFLSDQIQALDPIVEFLPAIVSNACRGRLDGEPGLAQLVVEDRTCDTDSAERALRVWWGLFWGEILVAVQESSDPSEFDPFGENVAVAMEFVCR